jgi:hypothetical protein
LTIAVTILLANGADLLPLHRADLTVNGVAEIVVAIALLLWAVMSGDKTVGEASP